MTIAWAIVHGVLYAAASFGALLIWSHRIESDFPIGLWLGLMALDTASCMMFAAIVCATRAGPKY